MRFMSWRSSAHYNLFSHIKILSNGKNVIDLTYVYLPNNLFINGLHANPNKWKYIINFYYLLSKQSTFIKARHTCHGHTRNLVLNRSDLKSHVLAI